MVDYKNRVLEGGQAIQETEEEDVEEANKSRKNYEGDGLEL